MLCNYCERGGGAKRRDCEGCANVLSVHNCVGYVFVAKFFICAMEEHFVATLTVCCGLEAMCLV